MGSEECVTSHAPSSQDSVGGMMDVSVLEDRLEGARRVIGDVFVIGAGAVSGIAADMFAGCLFGRWMAGWRMRKRSTRAGVAVWRTTVAVVAGLGAGSWQAAVAWTCASKRKGRHSESFFARSSGLQQYNERR